MLIKLGRNFANLMSTENYLALDDFIDGMGEEQKQFACFIVLAVISADGEVTDKESLLFEKILA